jgi:hypothetical protein
VTDRAPTYDWANLCSRERRHAEALARLYERDGGWTIGEPYWTGEEWKIPVCRKAVGP